MIDLFMEKKKMIRRKARVLWKKRIIPMFLFVVGALGVGLFILIFWVMFNECVECWAKRAFGLGRKREVIEFIGWGIAGILGFFGAIAVNKRADAQVRTAKAQAQTVKTQVENNTLIEKGHIQERFKTAVGHLGSEHTAARIASFHEFYYLARDNYNLRENIFDILCAHLRQTTTSEECRNKNQPTEEVQSLLGVLFQPKGSQNKLIFEGFRYILRGVFLVGADLRHADLRSMNLQCTDLRLVTLWDANLQGVDFWDVDLQGADLSDANLQDADFRDVRRLDEVKLSRAKLQRANFLNTDLQDTDLQDTDLQGANLRGADLRQVKNLETAKLSGAKIKGAKPPEGFEWPEDVNHE